MIAMIDEIFDRTYQHSRSALNGGIDRGLVRLGRSAMQAFRALEASQFSAPWTARRRRFPRDA